jgi:hypothetical protein
VLCFIAVGRELSRGSNVNKYIIPIHISFDNGPAEDCCITIAGGGL